MRGPGRCRRKLQRLLRDSDRGNRIVGALGFDEQSAQAQQPCVLAFGHGAECLPRGFTIALELRRLRVQQQRQRIIRGMAARDIGMPARGGGIAVADREQALRDGVSAPRATPFARASADPFRQPPQRAQDAPRQHRRDDRNAERQREHRQRGMNAPAVP